MLCVLFRYLYWGQSGTNAGIFRTDLDGSSTIAIAASNIEQPGGITFGECMTVRIPHNNMLILDMSYHFILFTNSRDILLCTHICFIDLHFISDRAGLCIWSFRICVRIAAPPES